MEIQIHKGFFSVKGDAYQLAQQDARRVQEKTPVIIEEFVKKKTQEMVMCVFVHPVLVEKHVIRYIFRRICFAIFFYYYSIKHE